MRWSSSGTTRLSTNARTTGGCRCTTGTRNVTFSLIDHAVNASTFIRLRRRSSFNCLTTASRTFLSAKSHTTSRERPTDTRAPSSASHCKPRTRAVPIRRDPLSEDSLPKRDNTLSAISNRECILATQPHYYISPISAFYLRELDHSNSQQ
jgi:hypothetical protein